MRFITIKKRNILMGSLFCLALIGALVATAMTGSAAVWNGRQPNAGVIEYIETDKNALALSFNVCSLEENHTREIMRILREHDARATFFVTGKWAEQNSELLREMVAQGIEIGSHGAIHQDMRVLSNDVIGLSLTTSLNVIENITGTRPVLFRFPYNSYNDRAVQVALSLGLRVVHYTTNAMDNQDKVGQEEVIMNVMNNANRGAIILMHNDGVHTVAALPPILKALGLRGMGTTTVGELMGLVIRAEAGVVYSNLW